MVLIVGNEQLILSTTTGVDFTIPGPTSIYTAPTTRDAVITGVTARCKAAAAITFGGEVQVETVFLAADVFAPEVLNGVTLVDDQYAFSMRAKGIVIPAGTTVSLHIITPAAAGVQIMDIDVIGYFPTT